MLPGGEQIGADVGGQLHVLEPVDGRVDQRGGAPQYSYAEFV